MHNKIQNNCYNRQKIVKTSGKAADISKKKWVKVVPKYCEL